MTKTTITLLIEDDRNICSFISTALSGNGYHILTAHTGTDGIAMAASENPDVVLLDLGLPDMDGCEVLRTLRLHGDIPVIVISARTDESDKVIALDLGADDYLTKPFGPAELMARIRNCLRRHHSDLSVRRYQAGGLEIDLDKHLVTLDGCEVHLTQIEYRLLSLLAEQSGRVLTYGYIMSAIWGPYTDSNNQILRVNMANIRRKIEKDPARPEFVFTEIGIGYRMRENESV